MQLLQKAMMVHVCSHLRNARKNIKSISASQDAHFGSPEVPQEAAQVDEMTSVVR
jgi:hypothetical protein